MVQRFAIPWLVLSLCAAFLTAPVMAGETGKIAGRVTDAATGQPLIGANVMIEGIWRGGKIVPFDVRRGAVADVEGFYYILNLPTETYAVKASMMGFSQTVLIENGRLLLGTWQSIYFCEFDGPRSRQVWVQVIKQD